MTNFKIGIRVPIVTKWAINCALFALDIIQIMLIMGNVDDKFENKKNKRYLVAFSGHSFSGLSSTPTRRPLLLVEFEP